LLLGVAIHEAKFLFLFSCDFEFTIP